MSEMRRLLWAMVAKELRTLLRERGVVAGLIFLMALGVGFPAWIAVGTYHRVSQLREFEREDAAEETDSALQARRIEEEERALRERLSEALGQVIKEDPELTRELEAPEIVLRLGLERISSEHSKREEEKELEQRLTEELRRLVEESPELRRELDALAAVPRLDLVIPEAEVVQPDAETGASEQETDEHREAVAHLMGPLLRWALVASTALLAILGGGFSPMALATVAGEKEAGTIELLLATPVTRGRLYVLKYLSVTLPPLAIVYVLVLLELGGLLIVAWWLLPNWLMREVAAGVLWAAPAPVPVVMLIASAEVYCSVRADTTKGAGQLFGLMFLTMMILIVVVPVVVGLLLPGDVVERILTFLRNWLEWPFAVQYLPVFGIVSLLCVLLLGFGGRLFDGDRLLT